MKLDIISSVVLTDFRKKYPDELKNTGYNIEAISKGLKHWDEVVGEREGIDNQLKVGQIIRILLYFIGSLLVIISRFIKNGNNI